ncbi:xanthine dehydrogenase/oxidase-like [Aricia agestis]|uniref:xanthine dehydrogenase/oxidase-like n=1 Tax=Aricia agestis TaxID=91739 RepID=UPI001C202F28|nr:xanthine dehydrogenase/oxidase-like [Aricia agestis]
MSVTFKINDNLYRVGEDVASTTSLLDYIRQRLELRGTKYMCRQGGCGACIVTVVRDGITMSVNSCLVSITSCHNWDITTIERVGNRVQGYHPLQTTLADYNGSQCGYCSPGWVMAMYSLLKAKPNVTMLEIENSLASNICRCTGYRPILDAFKTFGSDSPKPTKIVDIEDLDVMCKKTGEMCIKKNCEESEWCMVSQDDVMATITIYLNDGRIWFRVQELCEIFNIFRTYGVDNYMLVGGNTAKGAYPIIEYPRILIDITGVPILKSYMIDQNLVVGAATTLTELISIFQDVSNDDDFKYLLVLIGHLREVAHIPVRNIGTIAGNLMIKHMHRDFASDVFLLFETVGAKLKIQNYMAAAPKIISLQQFLNEDMKGTVIVSVMLPPRNYSYRIYTEKVAPRAQNAHAIVNAGFLYKLDAHARVKECRIVYGGLSSVFIRAFKTESHLINKELFNNATLQGAVKILANEIIVTREPEEFNVEYKRRVALNLLYKGLLALCPKNILAPRYQSGAIKIHQTRPVSEGLQIFETNPKIWPLNQPIPKVEGLIQCSGEAMYTEDMSKIPYEVFAAFVLTTVGSGNIGHIDPSRALREPGVIAFYSAKDIPGLNTFTVPDIVNASADEKVLCDGKVAYFNQPLGVIVAETTYIANKAALMVDVTYSNVRQPITDVRVAKTIPSMYNFYLNIKPTETLNDVSKIIKGSQSIFNQYHFCLENLAAISWPSDQVLITSATTQFLSNIQYTASKVLALPQNTFFCKTRRAGGAYGYKLSRTGMLSTMSNLVAHKLNRPCRFITPIQVQMRAIGKRMQSSTNYEVGVNQDGMIQYINYDIFEDNGCIVNELLINLATDTYYNCYDKRRWNYTSYNAITDTPSNTWFRAPGTLETITTDEMIMERIAYELDLDHLDVRLANLDPEHASVIKGMVNTVKTRANYDTRKQEVSKYNKENRWKKRGLRFTIMTWSGQGPSNLNIILSVYYTDGTVTISHGGIELGQGINTKAIQVCAYFLGIPTSKIKIIPNNTHTSPNNLHTAASVTSQNVALGVQRCCEKLLAELAPLRLKMNNPTWEELIYSAFKSGMSLQVTSYVSPNEIFDYKVYGVTLAEVEIDVLTGQWEILRLDLLEDVGLSVSPEIDIGQIEGAFIQGLGYWTTENIVYKESGEIVTDSTWTYWVPQARDIPQDFRVYFRKGSFSQDIILGSKATAEPATCMAVVVPLAMREAMVSARSESGLSSTKWFQIDGPYTVEKIGLACETRPEDFKFY